MLNQKAKSSLQLSLFLLLLTFLLLLRKLGPALGQLLEELSLVGVPREAGVEPRVLLVLRIPHAGVRVPDRRRLLCVTAVLLLSLSEVAPSATAAPVTIAIQITPF